MKKLIILVSLLLVITGCTANYQVEVNEDLSIKETIYITENEKFYKTFNKTTKAKALESVLSIYKDSLDEAKYAIELITYGEPKIKIEKKYSNIEEYLNSSMLFNDYFDEIKYDKKGNIITIETENFNKNDPDNPERFTAENLDVIIKPAFKIKKSNATKIDTKNNMYHFEYNDDLDDFKIFFELDTSSKFIPHMDIYLIIIVSIICIIVSWVAVSYTKRKEKK